MSKEKRSACKADARLVGVLTKNFELKRMDDVQYLCSSLAVKRLSGVEDIVPVYLPVNSNIDAKSFKEGDLVHVEGCIRTFSKKRNGYLILIVRVENMYLTNEEPLNEISVNGFLDIQPIARMTPRGRDIADLKIAVNYKDGRAYIPAIAWGAIARNCAYIEVGTFLKCTGEFHSREYIKKYEDGTSEVKTTYECSFRTLDKD